MGTHQKKESDKIFYSKTSSRSFFVWCQNALNCTNTSCVCHRDQQMPKSSQRKVWRFGMPTDRGTFWTILGSQIEKRVIWDLCMVSSGGTLVQSTQTCTQVQNAFSVFSFIECVIRIQHECEQLYFLEFKLVFVNVTSWYKNFTEKIFFGELSSPFCF